MQTAIVTVLLSGDLGNTVQKVDVTPSEVAVLRVLHGDDAVTDINILGEVARTSRAERERLTRIYGRTQPNGQFSASAVDSLFPGVAARLFDKFEELEMDDEFFKTAPENAASRVSLAKEAADAGVEVSVDDSAKDIRAAIDQAELTPEAIEKAVEDDGVDDMPDIMN